MFRIQLLLQTSLLFYQAVVGSPSLSSKETSSTSSKSDQYPLPNQSNVSDHDPNIFEYNDSFYVFHGGVDIPISKASSLDGPWTDVGTVLDGPSIIDKENRTLPWAPTTIQHNGSFYCFYTISTLGTRNSAIGVATTDSLDNGKWTDHGALINSGSGNLSNIYPYNESNAIDASVIVDNATGKAYLNYGSSWHGIFQVPLAADLLSVEDPEHPHAINLAYEPTGNKPLEGPWISFRDPYYYLWISHGNGQNGKDSPASGQEREIQVGRSTSVNGPFQDKDGKSLTNGGGTVVYASNHGAVYAPGGIGVLPANAKHPDILYYHYLNISTGMRDEDAHLGWNYLDYKDGWPVVAGTRESGGNSGNSGSSGNSEMAIRPNHILSISALIVAYVLM